MKEEEPSVLFLKNTFYQNRHVFLKHAQDDLQAISGALDVSVEAHSLSASALVSLVAKFSLQGCTGLLTSHSLRGKTLRPDGGALESGNGSLQHGAAALQLLVTFLHVGLKTM